VSGIHAYEVAADGSDIDETWYNEIAAAMGRIPTTSINPMKAPDYILWRSGDVYYAQDGRTGEVTSNVACHTLTNGVLDTNKWLHFVGSSDPYVLTGAIEFEDYWNAVVTGNPKRGTIFEPADTINAFEFDTNWYCRIQDVMIDGGNQTTSGMGLKFTEATGAPWAFRNIVRNVNFRVCYIGIGDLNTDTNTGAANLFQDITMYDSTFSDVVLGINGTGFWRFVRCTFDHVGSVCSDNYSFNLYGVDGLVLDTCSWLMGGATSKGGVHIENTNFIWGSNLDMEKTGLSGFVFKDCSFAQINNLRAHESSMDAGATGEANLVLLGCTDFYFTNTSLNIATTATNELINIYADGATQCDRITFNGGHVSNSAGYGAVMSDTSTYIKFLGVNFYSNANDDIFEEDTTDYNTYKNCTFESGQGWTLIGEHNTYDRHPWGTVDHDLSGAPSTELIYHAPVPSVLAGYRVVYTEDTSGDAGTAIEIGIITCVAEDDNYFDTHTSDINTDRACVVNVLVSTLDQHVIPEDSTITVKNTGGKVGLGEFRVMLNIIENAV
jgi:hypothetical protein